ncbi:MAG: ATPase [Candidatus Yanofskybacteria bacterium RIFCSPLOWO2_01_FULL_49_25]|uniref:P-type Cu(+) transporter n=1 Tax=Candidatus Yanofskybacteria bacterium RIFCSPLOWO2_01_FULL_49_25 TaxID=1802701 RepID=A0A1F8GUQ4_9BACT|nr:MAG: ATPase [Candidatus Yanofskybacteria bacterium RIFCSPLOWO2_01_FULL_49_25]
MNKKAYNIEGMHCASCSVIITKTLKKLDGVASVQANFATEKAQVEFDPSRTSLEKMNEAIGKLGYHLSENSVEHAGMNHGGMDHGEHMDMSMPREKKMQELQAQRSKVRFILPTALVVFAVMIWDMASRVIAMPGLPIPMEILNVALFVLASIAMFWVGKPFVEGVVRFIRYRVANMDTLVGIGTLTAYLYSAAVTLIPQIRSALSLPEYTYFDVVIVVIGFVTFGKYLEARSKQRTGEAIEKLIGLQAKTALVVRGGREIEIPLGEVIIGDTVVIKPGGKIPVDGTIIEGSTAIDESMITGESIPVDKAAGDIVIGATINKQGNIKITATKIGSDTMLSQIIKLVEEAQGSKAPIQALADKISSIFVPTVLGIAALSLALWLIIGIPALGQSLAVSYGILSFVGVLVIACPCALGLATPTAIIVGVGKGAENGVLIKDAESLELLSKVTAVVFDKTGTITKGQPEVTDVVSLHSAMGDDEVLSFAASLENKSEHPLARAIEMYAQSKKILLKSVQNFEALEGVGVQGDINGKKTVVRKPTANDTHPQLKQLQSEGKTVVIVDVSEAPALLIALADTIKDESAKAITALHALGLKTHMLTGDNHLAAQHIAKQAGIDGVIAEVLPHEKAQKIAELQKQGFVVAMVGDGINDAPALVQADVGIAMATGTDVAMESAGITLLHGDLGKFVKAVRLARLTMRGVRQNLFWAFFYNVVGIPIAAGLLYPIWGVVLNPIFAGMAMALSSVSVVGNSLRLKVKKL